MDLVLLVPFVLVRGFCILLLSMPSRPLPELQLLLGSRE